ncbi:hypothetical protein Rhal01_00530 [Rubritalea halochordaticola]|uniref:Cytochrome c domain-containing protein n=1 Tax=Rubritalea halochordaticola TaxID=714537 RepID=A0ABP9UVC8_9BACT
MNFTTSSLHKLIRIGFYSFCTLLFSVLFTLSVHSQSAGKDIETNEGGKRATKRLEVLFLGPVPSGHHPVTRFQIIRKALGPKGINFTYTEDLNALNQKNLALYDALLIYGNNDFLSKEQESALLDYSKNGGGCVFLHSACGCFPNSDAYIKLLGAQFKSHGRGVFEPRIVDHDHEVMKGFESYKVWDESYVHQKVNPDKHVLMKREEEPWTWVRTNGKGRIFYTASGHDERCWNHEGYQDLVYRGIVWAVGKEKSKAFKAVSLPKLEYQKTEVSIIHAKSWGEPLDRKVPHTHLQKALSVTESMQLAQVPADMDLQLFASEPDIINPIAINWDEKGRMWVVEAYDYPNSFISNKPGKDRIRIAEDTDGDGQADKFSTFAEGLSIATSVLPIKGGCITTDLDEMVALTDTNGDGKADKRRVIFKGIQLWDTHACVSNLRYGLDGWIYATCGYSGMKTKIGGKDIQFRQGVFRFKEDGSDFEFLQGTTNNTWGLSMTAEGELVGSTANNNPSFYVDVPNRFYSDLKQPVTPRADSQNRIYPITFDFLQVDVKNGFTAAAGHTIYNGSLFPKSWKNKRAFICEPTGKLVSVPKFERKGAGFKVSETYQNIYASADAWSSPVAAEVGPDGAVYIADWYNAIVQHNVYGDEQTKGKGNAYLTPERDRSHGRIYRISPKSSKPIAAPSLQTKKQCVEALNHPDFFWRVTAQRLLLDGDFSEVKNLLIAKLRNDDQACLHSIHILGQRLSENEIAQILSPCLNYQTPGIKSAVLTYLPKTLATSLKLIQELSEYTPPEKKAALLYLASVPKSDDILKQLKPLKSVLLSDPTLKQAVLVTFVAHGESSHRATVVKKKLPLSASAKRGAKVYEAATCIACHQPNGDGVPGAFPPLNGSEWLSRNHEDSIKVVLKGLNGPIKVKGKEFNGGMPAQESLSDQEIADVLSYVRNSWDNQLGDIAVSEVTRIRKELAGRKDPFTARDFSGSVPKAKHSYELDQSLQDKIGKKHAKRIGSAAGQAGNLSANEGEKTTEIKHDSYLDLPNNIISDLAKSSVRGSLTVEMELTVKENKPWAEAWSFGTSDHGEDKSNGASKSDYITLIPMNAQNKRVRLAARGKEKELFIDGKSPLTLGKKHRVIATFTASEMSLYVDQELVGTSPLPDGLDLTKFTNNNNWLGRSQFNDPMFSGTIHSLKLYDTCLSPQQIESRK